MINCLIIDDEPVARNIIKHYCSQLPFLEVAGECGNALEARELITTGKIDLLFLDIHMPVMNGVGFLTTLKNPPQVIFTTAYQEYAVKAFDLAACDYLLKPFSFERFIMAVDKVKEKLTPPAQAAELNPPLQGYFFIKTEGKLFKVSYSDCLYAEAQGNYTRIVTSAGTRQTKMSFSAVIAELPPALFIRVHRSFVVNKAMISHIEGNRVFIGQKDVPIALNYKEAFFKAVGINRIDQ